MRPMKNVYCFSEVIIKYSIIFKQSKTSETSFSEVLTLLTICTDY